MPFGLKNAPSEFQRIMNNIFNAHSKFCIVYIDDVLIFSHSIEQHFKHLHTFFHTATQNGLVVSKTKIFKQLQDNKEQILQYTSAHRNDGQKNYSTIKKEILSIVLCITKFQSDLLNQKFLLCVDCKSAKEVLQKDVQNLASKQIFARWQAILSIFDFDIVYIKGESNSIPDFLT